jgi:hypothetical protein
VALQDGVFDVLAQTFKPVLDDEALPPLNHTIIQATSDVSGLSTAAKTTMSAARTAWVFAQVWFNEYVQSAVQPSRAWKEERLPPAIELRVSDASADSPSGRRTATEFRSGLSR